jgi:DNA-binding NarL/FixJ family response regulator
MIIDDQKMFLEMLKEYFDDSDTYKVVHTQSNTHDLAKAVTDHKPELLLSDMMLPGPSVFEVLPQLLKEHPKLRIVVMSGMFNEASTGMLHKLGIHGIVSKMDSIEEIVSAISSVLQGDIFYPQTLLAKIKEHPEGFGPKISKREIEIMTLIASGLSEKQIASKLNIAENTVNNHKSNIFSKLGVPNQVSMVVEGIRRGLIAQPGITDADDTTDQSKGKK